MIDVSEVSFCYTQEGDTLRQVSFSVKPGACVLLCGESGCGKTTVTKLINGLIPHFTEGCRLQGSVLVDGMEVKNMQLYELAKKVGSVFQNPKSQFFNLDTDSELAFGMENQGTAPEQMEQRMAQTVRELEIGGLLHRNIFTLSGGEKQMLAFSSVYAMNPEIYVLDEPTANLDAQAIGRLKRQIQLLKEQGHTVLIAEHRLYFLTDVIDEALYFCRGRLERKFSRGEFLALTEEERRAMGLRSLKETELSLPAARTEKDGEGLTVSGLCCGYKKEADVISRLSFSAKPGEVLAVTGHNGIGKTTLVRCLCGLMKQRQGEISLQGAPLGERARRRESFLVMQDVNHQLFYDSVRNECEQAAGGVSGEQIEAVLDRFGLLPFKECHPMALSGGQKQRLAVATALLSGKRILIFDEPTSGLDYRHMKQVSAVVRSLAQQGRIVLVISHDREFMQEACDRLLELQEAADGRSASFVK
ncbi:ABC transporter, ATP-binding protein [Marvinbryantia formatexigens DSM 14469]|uniref:ABC transporter, ATP-binding protein n=1 Tax=Marvinbryantia formatexigens DSM 14469 TaxID=478749 RepID=C6LLX2_9FIRM|nr:energy-coupling factor ABC transporter ATP-binding protein [Marvinbryantia formatexigens]EET58382.1 ABC transporter, ATP-binding protein [Marvinbryantia formatexigens DSM 14469]UWO24326.1 energy-coupling factor ABC transporter ATP-binding protein [Marvinbryantia formatexigens DSM 14469]SDF53941.1 monosaccharide ABC transporter ATP-binding protein, CUT2 family (TC 3.A.1.2.-) [Marvinbryantia formatexigens]